MDKKNIQKEFDFDGSKKDIQDDIKRVRSEKMKELDVIFKEHNGPKKAVCYCKDCVMYRKLYFKS